MVPRVGGSAFERERVVGELRVFLMIYIILSIVPIWEFCVVGRRAEGWHVHLIFSSRYPLFWHDGEFPEIGLPCCLKIHTMRVYNFMFLLDIESIFL